MAAADTDKMDPADIKRKARRRLVGAIAMVVFVVIALPLVLDRDPKPISQYLSVQIPSQDSGKFNNRVDVPAPTPESAKAAESPAVAVATPVVPAPVAPASAVPAAESGKTLSPKTPTPPAAPQAKPESQAAGASKVTEAPVTQAPPAPKAEPAKADAGKALATKAAPAIQEPAAARGGSAKDAAKPGAAEPNVADGQGFVVPLGAYTNAANARQQRAKAKAAGVESYAEALKTDKGEQTRVRAGPFATKDAAEKARERLLGAGVKPVGSVTVR